MATEKLTVYPSAFDTGSYYSINGQQNVVGKGSSNTGHRCLVYVSTGSNKEAYAFWKFDFSAIPEDAVIDSVSGSFKMALTGVFSTKTVQLYSGSTAKGTATTYNSTSATVYTLSPGSWTRAELQNCRIRIYAKRGTSYTSNTAYMDFYGADLTVTYTYQSEKFMLKLGGAWHDVARVFKKVNGIWVEQTDLANVIEDGVKYKNGGEYVAPVVVTIAGSFYYEYSWVKVNGKQYTSATSVEVEPGTEVQIYTSSAFSSLKSSCGVKLNGTAVLSGAGTYTHIADRSCTITMKENVSDGRAYYSAEITTGGGG